MQAALVGGHGVGPARLAAFGNVPYAPVASNDDDAGKALNRRVGLVKQERVHAPPVRG